MRRGFSRWLDRGVDNPDGRRIANLLDARLLELSPQLRVNPGQALDVAAEARLLELERWRLRYTIPFVKSTQDTFVGADRIASVIPACFEKLALTGRALP